MKIAIATDHNGVKEKKELIKMLNKYEFVDLSTDNNDTDDYPDFAKRVAEYVVDNPGQLGVLMCGTGIGMSIAANKVKGIRAAVCTDHFSTKFTRLHNDTNILCLGGRVLGDLFAVELVDIFLETEYEGGRHQARLDKIKQIEDEN